MRIFKKMLSLILSMVMIITACPLIVVADTADNNVISVGDCITLGVYNNEPIVWQCVLIDENGPLMLSKDVLCDKEYDAAGEDATYHIDGWGYIRKKYGSNCWYDSNIRQWLNSDEQSVSWTHCPPSYSAESGFLTNFTDAELMLIKPTTRLVNVNAYENKRTGYCDGGSTDNIQNVITSSNFTATDYYYKYIEDSVFLLSALEYNRIYNTNKDFLRASSRYSTCITDGNNGACFEWVASIPADSTWAELSTNAYNCFGIRPAFYLNTDNISIETVNKVYKTVEQYMASVITNTNYNGRLSDYNGTTVMNYCYEYMLDQNLTSMSKAYVDILNNDTQFMASVAGWETLTFSPSEIVEGTLDEIGYYEMVIFNVINCAVEYTFIPEAVKDVESIASSISKSVIDTLSALSNIENDRLMSQNWSYLSESQQLSAINASVEKCNSIKKISNYSSGISDIFKTCETLEEYCEKLANLEKIAGVNEYIKEVLNTLYAVCPSSNSALKTAIYEVKTACVSSFDTAMVELMNTAVTGGSIIATDGIDTLWADVLSTTSVGQGVLIGQVVGKTLMNILTATEEHIEAYYIMRALSEFEKVMIDATKRIGNLYTVSSSQDNAQTLLTSIKLLVDTHKLSSDYATDYSEIIKTKGLINGVKSLFGFGNVQEFETYKSTCALQNANLDTFKTILIDSESYANAMYYDDYALYVEYRLATDDCNFNVKVVTVACPTDIEIYKGEELVVKIVDNEIVGVVPEDIAIDIDGDVKHIVLPDDENYFVKVIGTDSGTMDYSVSLYENSVVNRTVAFDDVALVVDCVYENTVVTGTDGDIVLLDENAQILNPNFDSDAVQISGASLTLQNDLSINYKVSASLFDGMNCTNPYIKFKFNNEEIIVDEYTIIDDKYVFNFDDIAPNQMNDIISSTLYVTHNGVEYSSDTKEYSVAKYCYNILEKYNTNEYAKLCTLLVDLLNYGSYSQIYTKYNAENLVNSKLTQLQTEWGTSGDIELCTVLDCEHITVENPTANWLGAGLNLKDSVEMRFKLATESTENLNVKITSGKGVWKIYPNEFEEIEDGCYYVYFGELNAAQMSDEVYLTVYDGDTAVSDTIRYSVESYAYAKQNDEDTNLSNLVKSMMKYGNSAKAYVN